MIFTAQSCADSRCPDPALCNRLGPKLGFHFNGEIYRLYNESEDHRRLWEEGLAPTVALGVALGVKPSSQLGPPPLCPYRGGSVASPNGKPGWVQCNHPDKPLKTKEDRTGNKVCSCVGCGPNCSGYPGYQAHESTSKSNEILVNHRALGLGDSLLGLAAIGGLKKDHPDSHIVYRTNPGNFPFVQLFHGGYDELRKHDAPDDRVLPGDNASGERQMNRGYDSHRRKGARVWERYRENIGASGIVLPTLREPDRLKEAGKHWRGVIALAPFSTRGSRNWRIESWITLVELLQGAGYRPVVIDNVADRLKLLKCEKLIGRPAEMLVSLLLNAAAAVCVESGIAHLSGILGRQTIVLCGPTTGPDIHGAYERVTHLQGQLACNGCWFNAPYDGRRCDPCCANLQTILPTDVLREVNRICVRSRGPRISLIIPTIGRESLRRTLDSLVGQPWRDGDEVMLVGDGRQQKADEAWLEYRHKLPGRYLEVEGGPHRDHGHSVRNEVMRLAKGSHIAALDDDDIWTPNALELIRGAITECPNRPHLFRMQEGTAGPVSPNIGTPMLVAPNDPSRLSTYEYFVGGDRRFIEKTTALYPDGAVQHEEVICVVRP